MKSVKQNSIKLGALKDLIANHFQAEAQLLAGLASVQNDKVRIGLMLRFLALQAQSTSTVTAVLVAAGCPLDLITKSIEYGEEVADHGVKEATAKLQAREAPPVAEV